MSAGEDVQNRDPLSEEEAGRADIYALIGRLFYEAPDSNLLAKLSRSEAGSLDGNSPLGQSWQALREACRKAYPVVVKQEYDDLFVGVGKSEVTLYTSNYIAGITPDRHLLRLRERLDHLGFARRSAAFEIEDHVSGICDVMRILIVDSHALSEQSLFFKEFTYRGILPVADRVLSTSSARFYRCVAEFARAFLEVERQAFEMHDLEA